MNPQTEHLRQSMSKMDEVLQSYYRGEVDVKDVMKLSSTRIELLDTIMAVHTDHRLSPEDIRNQYGSANYGLSWASARVPSDKQLRPIHYPRWSCWSVFENQSLLAGMEREFILKFKKLVTNTTICAISFPAMSFLRDVQYALTQNGVAIFPIDPGSVAPSNKEQKQLILFDLVVNTGRTAIEAKRHFERIGWNPSVFVTIIYNDLVPVADNDLPYMRATEEFQYIYKSSEFLKYWKDKKTASALVQIREAVQGSADWQSTPTQTAIERLSHIDASQNIVEDLPS